VIDAAVTDDVRAPPIPYVPLVDAEKVPKFVTAVVPAVVNDNTELLVFAPPDALFHEQACRA
jgi:hypothetical protein